MMKAVVYEKYGAPDVLHLAEVEMPSVGENEVLVKIHAASINYGDMVMARGKPVIGRLWSGIFHPKHKILGTDIAGEIAAVGKNARQFQPGDEVLGDISECGFGAFAEYVSVPEDVLVLKPAAISFEQAAAVPQASVVALQGLRNYGHIQSGQKVIINGASGGVGTFAIQIAKSLGTEVTGVCSARNLETVRSIGADEVIDYKQKDFTQSSERYDVIFDIVANHPVSDYMGALTPDGTYVACAFNPSTLFFGGMMSKKNGKKMSSLIHKPDREDLRFVAGLLETGKITPVIDKRFPLSEVPQAFEYLEGGRHHGKVIITVIPEND